MTTPLSFSQSSGGNPGIFKKERRLEGLED
jgi:hypothetical protein